MGVVVSTEARGNRNNNAIIDKCVLTYLQHVLLNATNRGQCCNGVGVLWCGGAWVTYFRFPFHHHPAVNLEHKPRPEFFIKRNTCEYRRASQRTIRLTSDVELFLFPSECLSCFVQVNFPRTEWEKLRCTPHVNSSDTFNEWLWKATGTTRATVFV